MAAAGAEHDLRARARQSCFADELEESPFEHGVTARIGQHLLDPQTPPSTRSAQVGQAAAGSSRATTAADGRHCRSLLRSAADGLGRGRGRRPSGSPTSSRKPSMITWSIGCRRVVVWTTNGTIAGRRPRSMVNSTACGSDRSRPCSAAAASKLTQLRSPRHSSPARRRRRCVSGDATNGIDTRRDPVHHAVGDQSALLPGGDAVRHGAGRSVTTPSWSAARSVSVASSFTPTRGCRPRAERKPPVCGYGSR